MGVKFRNVAGHPVAIEALGLVIDAEEIVDIAEGYALPRRAVNGGKRPSVVEQICPQLQPATPTDAKRVATQFAEDVLESKNKPSKTVEKLQAMGIAPGVARLLAMRDSDGEAERFAAGALASMDDRGSDQEPEEADEAPAPRKRASKSRKAKPPAAEEPEADMEG